MTPCVQYSPRYWELDVGQARVNGNGISPRVLILADRDIGRSHVLASLLTMVVPELLCS